jgi:cytochrome d ubiquinol oxidase subunit II
VIAFSWFVLIASFLALYLILDGYDLGIGVLLLLDRDRPRQREMIEIVATAWDANESWLILTAVALWGGFPAAYGVGLPAVYLPLVVMLFAIVFRGVAIEFGSADGHASDRLRWAFGIGSVVAAFAQGVIVGGLLSGVRTVDGAFAGGTFDFLTPYSVLTGLATVLLQATTGAAYLQLKGEGALRRRAATAGRVLLAFTAVLVAVAAVSLPATALELQLSSASRAVAFVTLVMTSAGAAVVAARGFGRLPDSSPFVALVVVQLSGLVALAVAAYPTLIPPSLTVEYARAPSSTLDFLLIGVGLNVPLLLFYSWYAHHVFRGKFRAAAPPRPPGVSATAHALGPVRSEVAP